MNTELNPYASINLSDLRTSLAAWQSWESVPVDAAKLGSTAQKLGFGHFRDEDILALWRIGILRADVVTSEAPASVEGLLFARSAHRYLLRGMAVCKIASATPFRSGHLLSL